MKKRILSLLLAVLMVLTVMLPLTVCVSAASTPKLFMVYDTDGGETWYQLDWDNPGYGDKVKCSVSGTTAFLNLNGFQSDKFAFYVELPKDSWDLFVNVTGSNSLPVRYYETKDVYMAIGTNGEMWVNPTGTGARLEIVGDYGYKGARALEKAYYGLYAKKILCGSSSSYLSLSFSFDLKLSQASSKIVFPFSTDTELLNMSYAYTLHSTHGFASPNEKYPIKLTGGTYFYTFFDANLSSATNVYNTVQYDSTFTGLVHANLNKGYFCGGPYGGEKGAADLGRRYCTTIGDVYHYQGIAKNCSFTLSMIDTTRLQSDLAFPLAVGYTLPDHIGGTGYDAKVQWSVEGKEGDYTGKQVEYDVKYTATVYVVPWGFHYLPSKDALTKAFQTKVLIPKNAYSGGFAANDPYETGLYFRYNPITRPALAITKQPVDFLGSATNKKAVFSVDSNDETATYQWQISNDGTSDWKNLTDAYTTGGGIKIGGAKAKNLTYNFSYEDLAADLKYFRCVVTRGSSSVTSNVAKYQYSAPEKTAIHHVNLQHKVPMPGDTLNVPTYSSWLKDQFDVTETWQKLLKLLPTTQWGPFASGSKFENGVYKVTFVLTPKTNFYLADDFSIDFQNAFKPVGGYKVTIDSNKVTVVADYNVHDYVSKLTLGGNWAPIAGKGINDYIPYPHAYDDSGNMIGTGTSPTDKVVIDRANCFWYEGQSVAEPEKLDVETAVFEEGKFYTYRFHVSPKVGITFKDDITFVHKDDPDDVTVTATKLDDGSYNVDFTYSRLAYVLGEIKLKYVDPAYGKKAYQHDVRSMENDVYAVVFDGGWYEESFGSTTVVPESGKTYYCTIQLKAYDGNRFTTDVDSITTLTYYDDGKTPTLYDSVEYKVDTDKYLNDTLWISLGFNCTEDHLYDCEITDLDSPKAGVALDREVTLGNPDSILKFVDYTINGKSVKDYAAEKPAAGDVVFVYVGVTASEGVKFDDYVHMLWTVDAGTPDEKSFKTYREYSYVTDPEICVFTTAFVVPTDEDTIHNFVLYMKPPVAGETLDHGRWFGAVGLTDSGAVFYIEDQPITAYDYEAKAGDVYEIRCFAKPIAGMKVADDAVATWNLNGEAVKGARADEKLPSDMTGYVLFTFDYTVPAAAVEYNVTVTDGTADKAKAAKGETVTVTANAAPEGKEFDKWVVVSGDVTLADAAKATTTFVMGEKDVELKATFKDKGEGPSVMLGDVNNDGKIQAKDARLALRAAVGLESYAAGSREFIAADVTKDGKVQAKDARIILRGAVGLEDPATW